MLCHVMSSIEAMILAFIKSKRVNKIACKDGGRGGGVKMCGKC